MNPQRHFVPAKHGTRSLLAYPIPRQRWACLLLLLFMLAFGAYLYRTATNNSPSGQVHRFTPHNSKCHGPRLRRAEEGGMFDYVFENGSLADRAFPTGNNTITAILQRPLTQLTKPSSCTFRGAAAEHVRYQTILDEVYDGKVAPVSVACTFASGPELRVARNGSDVMEITGLGATKAAVERVPIFDYRWRLSKSFDWCVCVPSLHGSPRYAWIDQWLYYYTEKLQVDHVFIYSALEAQALADLGESGVQHGLDRTSLLNVFSQLAFHPYYHGQVFAIHDCLTLQHHLGTEWVMFQDFDEVLTIPSTFSTPLHYFRQSSQDGETALTFGNWFVSIAKCYPEDSVQDSDKGWPWISRMVPYPSPHCGYLCPDAKGRRKYILRPSEHDVLSIHHAHASGGYTRHMNARSSYMRHYQGATDTSDVGNLFGICSVNSSDTAMPPPHQ